MPKYKQRIAGKSLPMEKFACKKSERYFNQGNKLVLPVLELMFLWNLFKVLNKNGVLASKVYRLIEKTETELNGQQSTATTPTDKYDVDNKCLVLLLKGACLRQMNSPQQAVNCLESVISLEKQIVEDTYLVPYAIVELGLVFMEGGRTDRAVLALEDAKRNYTGYSLESRLHFRIHTALAELKTRNNCDQVVNVT